MPGLNYPDSRRDGKPWMNSFVSVLGFSYYWQEAMNSKEPVDKTKSER